jgi:hypothetical protein
MQRPTGSEGEGYAGGTMTFEVASGRGSAMGVVVRPLVC